ncbi:C3HC4 type (RING finger) zinc finger protein (macronuclear) [Tetrahymena thermophila SB210]|uniref:C3HC4 type (RING finger) zinc finger protein n=1 Tax=Tetrahymena thermophila (strain SB210) TaxID=312017 RepID=I7MLP5_TETTS|nr:C3HC4 type (RING finger) zinc finger protein [Tetrahymena thermophila SB210]EAS02813.1 C3HC4 type (RING finger) zinc finger protein [Tetrahymena thermophila SB210]|eukprot:XP_001023058.1 C3HC4 type (RING finger) zinc finger protein [Tetrahymena thermophila SB210]
MAISKLLTSVIIYLIALQFCLADYETLQMNQLDCSLSFACQYSFSNIDFTKYQSLVLEVELESSNIPIGSSLQILQDQMQLLLASPSQSLIKGNRAIFNIPINSQFNSKSLIFSYISNSLFPTSSTFKFNLNLQGILLNSIQSYPCPFNCSGINGVCSQFDGQCSCLQNFKGIDCGLEGQPLTNLLDQEYKIYELKENESSVFYINNDISSQSNQDVYLSIYVKSSQCIDYTIYGGVFELKVANSGHICTFIDSPTNIKIQMSSQVSKYQNIIQFKNTNHFAASFELKFQQISSGYDTFLIDFSTQFGVIIITIISLISLVLLILVFCVTRSILRHYQQKKIAQFQKEQKTIQIDTKIPNQKYSEIVSKYPNIREVTECVVCLDEFSDQSEVRLTPCFHIFHNDCFNSFAHRGKSFCCPVCRRSLQDGEKEVFDYKLKMQASHTINEQHENKQPDNQSDNHSQATQHNQVLPKTAINSCHNIDEASNFNKIEAPQVPQNQIEGAVIINIQNQTDQNLPEINQQDVQAD